MGKPHHHGLYVEQIRCLATVLKCEFAVIGVADESGTRVVPFAVLDSRKPEDMAYDIAGSPCEKTLDEGYLFIPNGLVHRFPDDPILEQFDVDAYAGMAFVDPLTGRPGMLAVLMREPVCGEAETRSVLGAFVECIKTAREAEILQERFRREAEEQRVYADVLSALNKSDTLENRVRGALEAVLRFPEYTALRVVRFERGVVAEVASAPGEHHPELEVEDARLIELASRTDGGCVEVPADGSTPGGVRRFISAIRHNEAVLGAIVFAADSSFVPGQKRRIVSRCINDMLAGAFVRDKLELVMQQSIEEAKQAGLAKGRFLAKMSHELRSPINAILGFAEMLSEGGRDGLTRTQHDQLDGIRRNARHLLSMISDILDMGDVESGVFRVERGPCSVDSICNRIAARHAEVAAGKGLKFQVDLGGLEGRVLYTDPALLEQILHNLISNAVKFTTRGRVVLRVIEKELESAVVFEVADTGIGIAEELLEHVFEPFGQANDSYRRRFEGLGLGLSICKELAERLGGRLEVRSSLGEGSVFMFILPQRTTDSKPVPKVDRAPAAGDDADLRSRCRALFENTRVLVVEDSVDNRTLFDFYLRKIGAEPVFAVNGLEALDRVKEETAGFRLIVMDIQMPVMDGYEAIAKIRAMGVKTPILVVTANALESDRDRCFAIGCDGYLAKPVEFNRFIRACASHVEEPLQDAA